MRSVVLFLLIFLNSLTFAQVSPTVSFTENEGLIGNYVRDLLIDKEGLLWIATENGLSNYDGIQFKNFDHTYGLPSRKTGALAMDRDGGIFVGCSKGGIIKIKNDSLTSCVNDLSDKNHYYRKLLFSEYYNTLFVGTENGIFFLHNKKLIPVFYNKDTTERSIILSICARENLIFFSVLKGNSQGVYQLFFNQKHPEKSYAKRIHPKGRFYCTLIGNYLIAGEQNKLLKFNLSDLKKEPQQICFEKDFFVWNMIPYKKNTLLIGGLGDGRFNGGIYEYNIKNDQIEKVKIQQNNQTITSLLYQPDFELIWIGKENELVAYQNKNINFFTPQISEPILDINYSNSLLNILTDKGIYQYSNNVFIKLIKKETIAKIIASEYNSNYKKYGTYFKDQFDLSFGIELIKFVYSNNQLFVQTGKGSLSIPDLKTYLPFGFGIFTLKSDHGAFNYVNYCFFLEYESLNKPYQYLNISENKKELTEIIKMLSEKDNYFFLSSENGLFVKNKTLNYKNISNKSKHENELWVDMVFSSSEKLWVISNERLILINSKEKFKIEKQYYLNEIGINGNMIKWIVSNQDQLVIASNEGLYYYPISNLEKGITQPLFCNQWNGYPFISSIHPQRDDNGNIIAHTNHEIIWIKKYGHSGKQQKINIYDLFVNDKREDKNYLNNSKLSYSTDHIAFAFRVIHYPLGKNMIYRYKINDGNWIKGNQVDFQSLRIGIYHITLEVTDKSTNQKSTQQFQFQILPPFWETLWFRIFILISLSTLIFLLFKWRIKIVQKRSEEKTLLRIQNADLQLRSLQIQMNPHFIFNALNSIQYLVLSKNIKETLTYLGKLAGIIRTNLEFASENSILIKEEIEFLNNYIQIELLRFKNKFQFECKCEEIPDHLKMPPMLIQPIIENAIKHGIQNCDYPGLIKLEFKLKEQLLMITVSDNGIGRYEASKMESGNKKKHLGLSVIQQRLQLLNDLYHTNTHSIQFIDIHDIDNTTGTKVILTLPVNF